MKPDLEKLLADFDKLSSKEVKQADGHYEYCDYLKVMDEEHTRQVEAAHQLYQHVLSPEKMDLPKVSPVSKATTSNPKDLLGAKKVSLSKLPAVAEAWGAMAMMDGAAKYGAYNWRDKDVVASIYVDAARRHLLTWFEGQETASDSKVHHLGHAIACCAILLDAQFTGNLIDDRPVKEATDRFAEFLDKLSAIIKEKNAITKG